MSLCDVIYHICKIFREAKGIEDFAERITPELVGCMGTKVTGEDSNSVFSLIGRFLSSNLVDCLQTILTVLTAPNLCSFA